MYDGTLAPAGSLSLRVIRAPAKARLDAIVRDFKPRTNLGVTVAKTIRHLPPDLAAELIDRLRGSVVMESSLSLRVLRGYGLYLAGLMPKAEVIVERHGIVSTKVVTDAGVNAIVDAFQNTVELDNFKFHGIGTGSTAEAAAQTALVTELTTEYNPNSTRATGSLTEGATANIFKTVGTNTLDGAPAAALREHGIFTQASTPGGTLLDRSVFAAITLAANDALESTYQLTLTSGG